MAEETGSLPLAKFNSERDNPTGGATGGASALGADSGVNELPSVALTRRFLALCEHHGSQRLAVKRVAVGRSTGLSGLPASDDWTAWNAEGMRAGAATVCGPKSVNNRCVGCAVRSVKRQIQQTVEPDGFTAGADPGADPAASNGTVRWPRPKPARSRSQAAAVEVPAHRDNRVRALLNRAVRRLSIVADLEA